MTRLGPNGPNHCVSEYLIHYPPPPLQSTLIPSSPDQTVSDNLLAQKLIQNKRLLELGHSHRTRKMLMMML